MARFSYIAISATGERLAGETESPDRDAALVRIQQDGIYVVSIQAAGESVAQAKKVSATRTPPAAQVTVFAHEMSMLLKAGLPLNRALKIVQLDEDNAAMRQVTRRIGGALDEGKSFHEALAEHPKAFPQSFVSMMRVGEATGTLDKVLEQVAHARDHEQKLRSRMVSAMVYPSFLIATAIGAIALMLGFVVPRFKAIVADSRASVPEGARFVFGLSDWLNDHVALLLATSLGLVALIVYASTNGAARRLVNRTALRLPLVGSLLRYGTTINFCRSCGTLLGCGVDLQQALALTRDLFRGQLMGDALSGSLEALRKGQDFTQPLAQSGLLPPVAISILRVGQETGSLSASTTHLADMMEAKLEVAITRLFTIIEPLIIVLISLCVGGIVISIIGAIISVNDLAL